MLRFLLAVIAIVLLWRLGSQDAWKDEVLIRSITIALIVAFVPIVFAYFCAREPFDYERAVRLEVQSERDRLADKLNSKLRLRLRPYAKRLQVGATSVSWGGSTQTMLTNINDVVAVSCQNTSSYTHNSVRAYLVEVRKILGTGEIVDLPLQEPIELPWSQDGIPPEKGIQLKPEAPQTIYVLALYQRALMMPYRDDLKNVAVEAHMMFRGNEKFHIKVCAYADDSPPQTIWLEVQNNNPENENADPKRVTVLEVL